MAAGTTADIFPQTTGVNPDGEGIVERFFARLPAPVRDELTEGQIRAIGETLAAQSTRSQPVSLRFSLPFLFRRIFFAAVAGTEKRSNARLVAERRRHPLWTLGNSIFIFGCGTMFFLILFVLILVSSAILEY